MSIFKNNITLSTIATENNWRNDLTTRYGEYFSHKLNDTKFMQRAGYVTSVDEALENCETDYLLVQFPGHIPFTPKFFESLEKIATADTDIVVCRTEIFDEYIRIDPSCVFINMKLWKAAKSPRFKSLLKDGPAFTISQADPEAKNFPLEISIKSDRTFVPTTCCHNGAAILIKQLEMFGKIVSIDVNVDKIDHFYLDKQTPYWEIHNETVFEKKFLAKAKDKLFCSDSLPLEGLANVSPQLLVAPASGLRPYNLTKFYGATDIVIYDTNPLALEFQRRIFGVTRASVYGEIVEQFKKDFPDAVFADEPGEDEYFVVMPLPNAKVRYFKVDAFSFEMENLISALDLRINAVFDLSDVFVYPHNYYRRPLYQVQSLFAELYSLIKSRLAPSHVIGFGPAFEDMDKIEVNTSRVQYDEALIKDRIEKIEEGKQLDELLFTPPTTTAFKDEEVPLEFRPSQVQEKKPQEVKQAVIEEAPQIAKREEPPVQVETPCHHY